MCDIKQEENHMRTPVENNVCPKSWLGTCRGWGGCLSAEGAGRAMAEEGQRALNLVRLVELLGEGTMS